MLYNVLVYLVVIVVVVEVTFIYITLQNKGVSEMLHSLQTNVSSVAF